MFIFLMFFFFARKSLLLDPELHFVPDSFHSSQGVEGFVLVATGSGFCS